MSSRTPPKIDPVAFRIQNVVQGNDITQSQAKDPLLAVLNAVTRRRTGSRG